MELLIAILFAMRLWIDPSLSETQIKDKYPTEYNQAENIISTNSYHIDESTGIVIIDTDVGDGQ